MLFETAGIEVAFWIPPLVAFTLSFFTSMGGVSGAFLLLPFQMSVLGYTTPSVSATNQLYNIVAIPSGVYRYAREGRMVWPLTWAVIIGTLPGVFFGAWVRVVYLPDARPFKLFAAFVLGYIGLRLVRDLVRQKTSGKSSDAETRFQQAVRRYKKENEETDAPLRAVKIHRFDLKRIEYEFYGERYNVPFLGIFSLSLVVGVVGGIYGIGGGAIVAPFFVSFYHLPVYTVAGAALMGTFVTSVAGVAFYQVLAWIYPEMTIAPDWLLGSLFGVGGLAGMYLGARFQKYVPAKLIKWMLGAVILITGTRYVLEFFGI